MSVTAPNSPSSPSWGRKLFSTMTGGWGKYLERGEELSVDPREVAKLKHTEVTVVFKPKGDVIFQFFPQSPKWPPPARGRDFLAEIIEAHYGDTSRFSASYVAELKSWAVKAAGLATMVSYRKSFHVDAFIELVDNTVDAL